MWLLFAVLSYLYPAIVDSQNRTVRIGLIYTAEAEKYVLKMAFDDLEQHNVVPAEFDFE